MTSREDLLNRPIPIRIDSCTYSGIIREVLGVNPQGQHLGVWIEAQRKMIYVTIPEQDERLKP